MMPYDQNWNSVVLGNIHNIIDEVDQYYYIKQYAPVQHEDIIRYNDELIAFKRMYCDAYRFINCYIPNNTFTSIMPRHYYWKITLEQLNNIIYYMMNGSNKELAKYMMDIGFNSYRDMYINALGEEKLSYINLKLEMSCH